jgi:sulfatase maturation enzyme AslB (radical SAM superfamily)
MRYPLRLNIDLLQYKIAHLLTGRSAPIGHISPAIFTESPADESESDAAQSCSAAKIAARILSQSSSPVFWLGGSDEPLQHISIGSIVSELNRRKRTVFLHTNGARLRQRIHEFRPDSRLYLTVELTGREAAHDAACAQAGAYRRIIEGVRAAKLSGFHVCAHVTVTENSDVCEAGELFEDLDRFDMDGFIVSTGGRGLIASNPGLTQNLSEIRSLVRSGPWENVSKLLEASYTTREESAVSPLPDASASAVEENA